MGIENVTGELGHKNLRETRRKPGRFEKIWALSRRFWDCVLAYGVSNWAC